ncbi:MAG: uL15 family ribosomal protein [Candidatus Pacebacteria bacterium]|nr:uL15 family ribosomal protein [Candidatus Paceibacterota bacterium]
MQIHNLQKSEKIKPSARVGRGGKRGTYSGKGIKGQRSRAGRKIKSALHELFLKFPKRRGITNNVNHFNKFAFGLSQIADLKDVNLKTLREAGFIPKSVKGNLKIKIIVSDGFNLDTPINVSGCFVSKKAEEQIIKAGGKVNKNK